MSRPRKPATENDVLSFYTRLLKGEIDEAKLPDIIKAAEFFVKYHRILEKRGVMEESGVVIIDNIPCGGDDDNRKVSQR